MLNFENTIQVKSFENFKYPKSQKITSIWDIENCNNMADNYHNYNSGALPSVNNKDFVIKFPEDNINRKNGEESKIESDDEYFNYASFELEDDISKKIKEYFNPNIQDINNPKKNKYGYFDNYKDEHKFKKPNIIREKKPTDLYNDLYNEYYEDLKLKINFVKNGEKLVKKLSCEEDLIKEDKKAESSKILPNPISNKNKQNLSMVILEEHFK